MSLDRPPSALDGVRYGVIARFGDVRGSFREIWRASVTGAIDPVAAGAPLDSSPTMVQANLSTSSVGVLRGLHVHRRQLDHWVVASGRALVALVDIRPCLDDGAAEPRVETRELAADDWVDIPAGVAHGFLALDPLELVYFVTNEYDGSDELGFAWDDPDVGVPWPAIPGTPDGGPILSERDQANPRLAALLEQLRGTAPGYGTD